MVAGIDELGIVRNGKYLGQWTGFALVKYKAKIVFIAAIGGRNFEIEFAHDNLPKKREVIMAQQGK